LITHPEFFRTLDQLLQSVSLEDWKTYLRWHLLRAISPTLDTRFATESFINKALNGQLRQKERWKRCLQATDRDLGDALGQQFVKVTFHPEDKQRVLAMMEATEAALHEEIEGLPWFTEATKREALVKVDKTLNRVGYPDQWTDYSKPADHARRLGGKCVSGQ
jgi:putative endopeptidase